MTRSGIAAAVATGAILVSVIGGFAYYVATYRNDDEIAQHTAECTAIQAYKILRAEGGTGDFSVDYWRQQIESETTKFKYMADEAVRTDPGSSRREYLLAYESVACR